jgi:membrane fusion protein, multidrug efflux system
MKRIVLVTAAALATAGGVLFLGHRGNRKAAASVPPPAVPVTVDRARTQDMPVWLAGVGTVQALNTVSVKVRVDGQLERMAFVEGTDVRRGDLLAQVDPLPFQAQLDQAVANLGKDQAQLANAQVNLGRFEKLVSMGAAPSQNVDTLRAQVAQFKAAVQGDRALIATARLNLGFTTIRSPIDGRVGLRLVDPGSIVHASDPSGLVIVTQMQPIGVVFSLPQDQLPALLATQGKLTVAASSHDGSQDLGQGEVAAIDSQIDPSTGQVRLKAVFANPYRTLWPGQFVSVRVLLRTVRAATVVPSQAVLRGQDGPYVYAVKADSTIEMRPVKVGQSLGGLTSVLSGLSPDETVVVAGQARIAPGTRVKS